jgi:AcrR family transcriptional regulator
MDQGQWPHGVRSSAIADRAQATRNALIVAARELFVEKGYFSTGTEEIVAAAGAGTRGALYHHFADKRALFVAVFESVEEDLAVAAASRIGPGDILERLRTGLMGFLDASLTPAVQRILLIDGPAVIGWQQWRSIEEKYGLGLVRAALQLAVAEGSLPDQPVDMLAHILLAAINEAALCIANAPDAEAARIEAVAVIDQLFAGLIPAPAPGGLRHSKSDLQGGQSVDQY